MSSAFDPVDNVNPARAGMILGRIIRLDECPGKPRASGDDPAGAFFPSGAQR